MFISLFRFEMEVDKDENDILDLSALDSGFLGADEDLKEFSLAQSPPSKPAAFSFPSLFRPPLAKKQQQQQQIDIEPAFQVFVFPFPFLVGCLNSFLSFQSPRPQRPLLHMTLLN